ncbi:MAG: Flagellar motor switch protein FliN [Syntrophorhabdus sp. PtaB.Bin184]|jgi:flagellar motor switch protein FliN/FliY|nr:MAG: Flagellar motor switch protein FliN [Syntrophorhabdus sp. PtaB.Bin184]
MEDLLNEAAVNETPAAGTNGGTKKFEMNIDSLLDISVDISVEIGRTKLTIGELLALSKGSIIELNRIAGESVDIYVNDKLLGKGEIVLVNERLGVRIMEILTPKERVQELG